MCIFAAVAVVAGAAAAAKNGGHGWGDSIEWRTYDEALKEAKERNVPIAIFLHKTWCHACKRLRPIVAASSAIAEQSKQFVMVSAEDEEQPHGVRSFEMDGSYIPRVVFVHPNGHPNHEIWNESGNPQYRSVHSTPLCVHPVLSLTSTLVVQILLFG